MIIPDGWRLVPNHPTQAWCRALAEARQGQSSTPQCEPPSAYAIQLAHDTIKIALAAFPSPPTKSEEDQP
jgi:hypothetical protein